MKTILLISFNCFLFSFAAESSDKNPEITWAFVNSTRSLNLPNTNIFNENHFIFKLYKTKLADYNHTIISATLTRIEAELKSNKLVCFPGSSEFTRRKEFSYLTSQYIQPSPQLIVSAETGKKILKKYKGKVSLTEILNDPGLKGTVAEGRSYGEVMDGILKKNPSRNLSQSVYSAWIKTVSMQIKNGRLDYTLENPFVVRELEASDKHNPVKLVTIALSDSDKFVTQYVACAKTPEGLKVIRRLDQVIMNSVGMKQYWQGVLKAIPKEEREDFQKHIDSFVSHRQHHSLIIK